MNVGTTQETCCPECDAGSRPDLPMIDLRDEPSWAATIYQTEPWNSVPAIANVPFSATASKKVSMFRKDAFHTLKFGILKDLAAGMIMWLCQEGCFDFPGCASKSMDARLERAFKTFQLWTLAEKKSTSLRKFSRINFHRVKATRFPFLPGKGADSLVCCSFLEFQLRILLREHLDDSRKELYTAMLQTVQGALNYVGVYHSHGIFMPKPCTRFQLSCGYRLLRGYGFLASRAMREGRRFFALRPKLHYHQHMLLELQGQVLSQHEIMFNYAACFNCESNEDFIGRVARMSRKVSPKLTARRTIERYLVAVQLVLRRAGL